MFARIFTLLALSMAAIVSGLPASTVTGGSCNTGTLECCKSVQSVSRVFRSMEDTLTDERQTAHVLPDSDPLGPSQYPDRKRYCPSVRQISCLWFKLC